MIINAKKRLAAYTQLLPKVIDPNVIPQQYWDLKDDYNQANSPTMQKLKRDLAKYGYSVQTFGYSKKGNKAYLRCNIIDIEKISSEFSIDILANEKGELKLYATRLPFDSDAIGSFGFTVDNAKDMTLILENAINAFKIVNTVDYTQMPLYTNN